MKYNLINLIDAPKPVYILLTTLNDLKYSRKQLERTYKPIFLLTCTMFRGATP